MNDRLQRGRKMDGQKHIRIVLSTIIPIMFVGAAAIGIILVTPAPSAMYGCDKLSQSTESSSSTLGVSDHSRREQTQA